MAFSVTSACISSKSLDKTYVNTVLSTPLPTMPVRDAKDLYGPPKITLVVDVSGSMMPNMKILKHSLLALFDMAGPGSCIRVISFDETPKTILKSTVLSIDSIPSLKKNVMETLVNDGKSTNLQRAIHSCLVEEEEKFFEEENFSQAQSKSDPQNPMIPQGGGSDPHLEKNEVYEQITLFASDGLANLGLTSSQELLSYARTYESYSKQTFYTLGIKLSQYVDLNSEFLKDMALDSGGYFQITSSSSGIAEFLGDVLAHHYFVRYTNMHFTCTSSNGLEGMLCTKLSQRGGILREDRPLDLTWEFQKDALPPFTFQARMKKRPQKGSLLLSEESKEVSLQPETCSHYDIEKIFGCTLVAPAKDRLFTFELLKEKIQQFEEFMKEFPNFQKTTELISMKLKKSLETFGYRGEQTTQDSMDSFAWSSGGGAILSVQAGELRNTALQATQAIGDDDLFDSQKTIESESTKRQRKN